MIIITEKESLLNFENVVQIYIAEDSDKQTFSREISDEELEAKKQELAPKGYEYQVYNQYFHQHTFEKQLWLLKAQTVLPVSEGESEYNFDVTIATSDFEHHAHLMRKGIVFAYKTDARFCHPKQDLEKWLEQEKRKEEAIG